MEKGFLVVLSGPSGTGKGTLMGLVKKKLEGVRFSVSATTRNPRKGEIEGKDYFYKSKDEFMKMIENDEFIEWVNYCNNYYGTPVQFVSDCIDNGENVLLEIEVEGAQKVQSIFPESVLIFVIPPSLEELKRRIKGRGTESEEVINARLQRAIEELKLASSYDYIIVNDKLDKAFKDIQNVVYAERLKSCRNIRKLQSLSNQKMEE